MAVTIACFLPGGTAFMAHLPALPSGDEYATVMHIDSAFKSPVPWAASKKVGYAGGADSRYLGCRLKAVR